MEFIGGLMMVILNNFMENSWVDENRLDISGGVNGSTYLVVQMTSILKEGVLFRVNY